MQPLDVGITLIDLHWLVIGQVLHLDEVYQVGAPCSCEAHNRVLASLVVDDLHRGASRPEHGRHLGGRCAHASELELELGALREGSWAAGDGRLQLLLGLRVSLELAEHCAVSPPLLKSAATT